MRLKVPRRLLPGAITYRLFYLLLGIFGLGCTSIGMHNEATLRQIDFGPPQQVRLCVQLDDGVTEADARQLISSWNSEVPRYGLYVTPISFEHHSRSDFFHAQ